MNVYLGELYKEVEYIQSSGTQYIDTGIKGNISSNLSVDYKFTLVQNKSSGQQSIFGNVGSNGQGLTIYWDANSNQQGTWCGSGTGWYPGYITVGSATTINASFTSGSGRTFSINGTTYTNSASNPSIDNGLNYFIFNDGRSSLAGYFKIYYFKIYKDGTLVRDFIPCYRVSDNVIGLFDKVENKFYTNAGTGSFTKGNDVKVFQPELKNAYIGEVYEYSYDFRNKALAQIQADGFSVGEGTVKLNSSGISSNSGSARIIVNKSIPSLSNAKKITVTQNCILSSGSDAVRLNGSGRTYATGIFMDDTQNRQMLSIANTNYLYSGLSSGTYTQKVVFDLVNKTATLSCTGKTDHTETITDTEITNIRNNVNNIETYVYGTTSYIQTISIIIE